MASSLCRRRSRRSSRPASTGSTLPSVPSSSGLQSKAGVSTEARSPSSLPSGERPDVGARLLALVRKELIRPDRSDFPGDDGFRFAHMLIRDAAYDSTPKELRAELHERYADWLELKAADRIREYEEILGFHLEQACRYRRELAPLDEQTARSWHAGPRPGLPRRGAEPSRRGDAPAAVALLSRALSLLPEGDARPLARFMPDLGEALGDCGDWARRDAAARARLSSWPKRPAIGEREAMPYSAGAMARGQSDPGFTATEASRRGQRSAGGLRGTRRRGRPRARLASSLRYHHTGLGHYAEALQANRASAGIRDRSRRRARRG